MAKSRAIGIDLRTGTRVEAIEKSEGGFTVRTVAGKKRESVAADLVVHAAGRVPDLDALDLAAAGVERDKRRPRLNEFLQSTSNPAVYAAGDAAGSGPPLTPVASHDGRVVAANMLEGNRQRPNYFGVPSVAFTILPTARVGLLETEAREKGLRVRVKHENTAGWYTARRVAEAASGFRTIVAEDSGRILGAHLIGPHADEVINLFGLLAIFDDHAASKNLRPSRSRPARPYMVRFSILRRLICPSTGPLLQPSVIAARTAS